MRGRDKLQGLFKLQECAYVSQSVWESNCCNLGRIYFLFYHHKATALDRNKIWNRKWKLKRLKWLNCVRHRVLQDSLDELEMDDYWKEVENITQGAGRGDSGGEGDVQEEEQNKTPEGRIHCVHGQTSKGHALHFLFHVVHIELLYIVLHLHISIVHLFIVLLHLFEVIVVFLWSYLHLYASFCHI